MASSKNNVNKAVGIPSDLDLEHEYRYCTGYHTVKDYWWVDRAGNYWRYTNAPEDHEDHDVNLGWPLIHPEQPFPDTNQEYFTEDGFKRNQALAQGLVPQRNGAYNPEDPRNNWFEVAEASGLVRYVYLDKDIRENLDLWVQYQLRLADASLLEFRKYTYNLFKAEMPKDKVMGCMLMLMDQALYLPEELADFTVADVKFLDQVVQLGNKQLTVDQELYDFFTSIVSKRLPEDPLFVIQTIHGTNSVGYNHLYSLLSSLKMDPYYLIAWHVNHMFSRILSRMAFVGVPLEEASEAVYEELAAVLGDSGDIRHYVDTKVKNSLFENYEESGKEPQSDDSTESVAKSIGVPSTHSVFSDVLDKRSDEMEFSVWLHTTPMHDISPEEEDRIQAQVETLLTQKEDTGEDQEVEDDGKVPEEGKEPPEPKEKEAPPKNA